MRYGSDCRAVCCPFGHSERLGTMEYEYVLEECTEPHEWIVVSTYPYTAMGLRKAQISSRARRQDNVAVSLRLAIQEKSAQ